MKTDLSQSCDHCWVFQICWHIECSTFTASSFRIWNSSTGIPLPPLALFVVMLSKAHLTSHSRMSGSRWVITPSWLSGSWRSFLHSSVYSCYHFLISSAYFFPSISLHWSLRKAFLSLFAILWNSAFRWVYLFFSPLPLASLLFSAICKASSENHFAHLHFFFLRMVLITASCTMSQTSVYSSSGTLSLSLIPWLHLSLPLYNCKGFDLGHI